jgi:hypothetical protein
MTINGALRHSAGSEVEHLMVTVDSTSPSPITIGPQEKTALLVATAILGIPVPLDTEHLANVLRLSRCQAARFLNTIGYPVSANRLAKLAVHGGGAVVPEVGAVSRL